MNTQTSLTGCTYAPTNTLERAQRTCGERRPRRTERLQSQLFPVALILVAATLLPGCEAIAGFLEMGIWFVIYSVALVALVGGVATLFGRR